MNNKEQIFKVGDFVKISAPEMDKLRIPSGYGVVIRTGGWDRRRRWDDTRKIFVHTANDGRHWFPNRYLKLMARSE